MLHALTRLPRPPMLRLASGFRDWLIFHVRQSCVGGIQTIHSCSLRCGLCATADSRTAAVAANVTGPRLFPVPQVDCCCAESRKLSLNHTAGASRRYPQYCPLRKILSFFFFWSKASQSAVREVVCVSPKRTPKSTWIADNAVRFRLEVQVQVQGRDGEEKLTHERQEQEREEDRMNLKSDLIFTLYTIYGILFKGEAGMSGARVFVCVPYACLCAHAAGQQGTHK